MKTPELADVLHENPTILIPTHGPHWQMARYELPIKEIERKVGNRYVTDIVVGDTEKLAYVHKYTGKRVEFTRPRLDNTAAYLEEAQAKFDCELAIAEANKRQKASCIIGHIQLPRTNAQIVEEWTARAVNDPAWLRYPTKLVTRGAFGAGETRK